MKKKYVLIALAFGLSLSAKVMAQVPSYVPTNGLVGWWPFNGNANDESGNGNNGTVNGATLTADRYGNVNKAHNFNGINQWIEVPDNASLDITQEVTISAWVYKPIFEQRYEAVVVKDFNGTNTQLINYKFQINESNQMTFYTSRGNTGNNFSALEWHHFVGICTMDSIKVFLDNNLVWSSLNQFNFNNLSNNNLPLTFGRLPYDEPISFGNERMYFKGKMDDIGIWNRALTDQEIFDLYNSINCSNNTSITPQTNSISTGGNVTFSANTSDANATFSWQSDFGQGYVNLVDFGNYSGTNTASLTISNVQLANHNQPIRAISTSGNCVDTSNNATIQITDTCITNVTVYDTLYTTVTDTLIINTTLGLPAPNNENTILIYPNPASDYITIDNGNYTAMAGYSIKITNNAGQQVFQSAINQAQFYVDLSTWTGNGLYFVHLLDAQNNAVTVRKIVLQ